MSHHDTLSIETLYEGWGRYSVATIRLPDGTEIRREIEDHGSAVTVLPYDPERRVAALVRQLRAPVMVAHGEETVLEAPAGRLDPGEAPEECVRREAMEEVGLRLGTLEPLGPSFPMPGISTEVIHLYLAPYGESDRQGQGGGLAAEHENIVPVEIGLAALATMAEAGELPDMKTHLLLVALRLRRPDLFG